MSLVADLSLTVEPDEVLRYLGYRHGGRPKPRVARRLEELWSEALALARPRGAYRIVERGDVAATQIPRATPRLAVAVVTIGRELETEARRRGDAGRVLDSLLFDAIGSAAAEAAADALNREICVWARGSGQHPAPRVSPGYGRWSVAAQGELLRLLPARDVGVALTAARMLVPHKSVSFAVRFEERPQRCDNEERFQRCDNEERFQRYTSRCKRCGLVDCPYRHVPEEEAPPH